MKILYGVQATGNGHISRAHAMAKHFESCDIQVDYLFSGRAADQLFDMEIFGNYQVRRGITFITEGGKIRWIKTALKNNFSQLWKDIKSLDVSSYDLIITDYEPITAHAGKQAGIKVIGLGHQYAFLHNIPKSSSTPIHYWAMHNIAPADIPIGLHWHHFGAPVLPPIAPVLTDNICVDKNTVLVYLPFENLEKIKSTLKQFPDYEFVIYHPDAHAETHDNLRLKALSRTGFHKDLLLSGGVLCNSGFELPSEAMQLGKKLLVKPVRGQMEQLSNAIALEELELGWSTESLDHKTISDWLKQPSGTQVVFPDVAGQISQWITDGMQVSLEALTQSLWEKTKFVQQPNGLSKQKRKMANAA